MRVALWRRVVSRSATARSYVNGELCAPWLTTNHFMHRNTETELARLDRYASILDNALRLPGGIRLGLDGIIGLVPGLGDAVSGLLSGYIVFEAYRLGAARSVLARMCANIFIETVIGSIPILGDIFDIAFKANVRNVSALRRHLQNPRSAQRRSRGILVLYAIGAITMLTLAVGLPIFLLVQLVRVLTNV
jgi:hypothetical protein